MAESRSEPRASRSGRRVLAATNLAAIVLAPAVAFASTTVFRATFDAARDEFVYVDDAFLETHAPNHASGEWSGVAEPSGTLEIRLGAAVRETVLEMSGAWERRFVTERPLDHVRVRVRCRLTLASGFEPDEHGQLMISLDGEAVAAYGLDYVHRLVGDGDGGEPTTTGWIVVALDTGRLAPGEHRLRVGAWLSKKTAADETLAVSIDEVEVTGFPAP